MIRLLMLIVAAGVVGYIATSIATFEQPPTEAQGDRRNSTVLSPTPESTLPARQSVFVPYWSLSKAESSDFDAYDSVIYFGVAANERGVDRVDQGYSNLKKFDEIAGDHPKKLLTIRMVNSGVNTKVLKNTEVQHTIAQESVQIAHDYDYDAILLDFELSGIGFEEVTKQVTAFYTLFSKEVKKNKLEFHVTLYGDTYYRVRSYDVRTISKLSDDVLIMAYDFHKARGNPGPNFPLNGKDEYGYDFVSMIEDFRKDVPVEKLTIIFGMFGYDWTVDKDQDSTGFGEGKSTLEIETSMVNTCKYSDCSAKRHELSQESRVTYRDADGMTHIVWYEDELSTEKKRRFLDQQGIRSISWWAYSYF